MANNQEEPLGLVKSWIQTDKGLGKTLSGASGFFRILGFEEIVFLLKSSTLPLLKSGVIEHTTSMGDKTTTTSENQVLNDISFSILEKDTLIAKNAIECIQTSGMNGELSLEFYVGNSQFSKPQLWGYGLYSTLKIEDGIEIDSESTESPMSISGTISTHYFPPMPNPNENLRASASETLGDLLASKGTGVVC